MRKEFEKTNKGTANRPRLVVFRSNKGISAQLVNDKTGETITSASYSEVKEGKTPIEKAQNVGKLIGDKTVKAKISEVVFDRNDYQYHGQVKALAEGARSTGLKF